MRFYHHKSLSPGVIIGQRDMHSHGMACGGDLIQSGFCPTCEVHFRLASFKIIDRHVFPRNAHPQSRPQRFGTGFFCRPALGIGASLIFATGSLVLFISCEDPIAKPVTKPLKRCRYAVDICQIGPDPQNHLRHALHSSGNAFRRSPGSSHGKSPRQ